MKVLVVFVDEEEEGGEEIGKRQADDSNEDDDEEEEDEDDEGDSEGNEDEDGSAALQAKKDRLEGMTYAEREMYHNKTKEKLADLANQILENPEEKVGLLGHFYEIFQEPSATVKKLCLLTQFAIFRDILPG